MSPFHLGHNYYYGHDNVINIMSTASQNSWRQFNLCCLTLSLSLFQIWRALRLVVDTGLHFKGKSREWALKTFVDYAWDTSDKVEKEVTRYQSIPGQAVTYILGQLSIMELKEEAEKALGAKFNLRDFHFQVLINLFPLRLCLTLPLMGSFHVRPLLVHCI